MNMVNHVPFPVPAARHAFGVRDRLLAAARASKKSGGGGQYSPRALVGMAWEAHRKGMLTLLRGLRARPIGLDESVTAEILGQAERDDIRSFWEKDVDPGFGDLLTAGHVLHVLAVHLESARWNLVGAERMGLDVTCQRFHVAKMETLLRDILARSRHNDWN